MWTTSEQHRLDEVAHELENLCYQTKSKTMSDGECRRMKALNEEGEQLLTAKRTHQAGLKYAGYGSTAEWGMTDTDPGAHDSNIAFKGFGAGMENRIRPTSMYEIDKTQVAALKQAAQQRTSFRVQVGSKGGIEHGDFTGQIHTKAAVTEGGLTPNLMPVIQQPGPSGWYGLPYELTRVANFLPNVAFEGPGIAYWRHDSNTVESGYVAEGALKPDLTPVVSEQYVRPAKVAGRINLTHELVQDAGDAFTSKLVTDLARSLYNSESALLLNGTKATNGFDGINSVSGTLTRAYASGTDVDALGTLNRAFVDLRQDFFEPDLVFIHPQTLGSIRRLRDLNGRLQLDLLAGARNIDQTNNEETLWGCRCVATTQQAVGTAAVLSVQSAAPVVYVREALTTFFDPYSQAASNIYQFVAETRIALAIPRPSAINLVTGLPTS